MVQKKKFFLLFLPLFHKLEMIQKKSSKSLFQLWQKALTLYLTENKGCSLFSQPNLFVLTVGGRLPGVGWANSSLSGGPDLRLGPGGPGYARSLSTEHTGRAPKLTASGIWGRRREANQDSFYTRLGPSPLASAPKGSEKEELGEKREKGEKEREERVALGFWYCHIVGTINMYLIHKKSPNSVVLGPLCPVLCPQQQWAGPH